MFVVVTVVVVIVVVAILVCHCQWVWDFNCDCMSVSWPNASPASRQLTRNGSLTLHLPYYHSLPLSHSPCLCLFLPHSVCTPIRSTKLRQLRAIHNPQSACIVHFVGEGSEVGWQRWWWCWWWLRRLLISGQSYQFTIRIQFAYYFGICDKPLAFSCHLKRS